MKNKKKGLLHIIVILAVIAHRSIGTFVIRCIPISAMGIAAFVLPLRHCGTP